MAAVGVTISGYLADKYGRWIRPVTLVGEASLTGLGVGGGPPIIPPDSGGGDPNAPHPEHPVVLPDPPPDTTPPGDKPPPAGEAGWGFYDGRWGYFPAPTDAGPHTGTQ